MNSIKLTFDHASAYELVVSLYRYIEFQTSAAKHIENDRKWREQVHSRLSTQTATLLADTRLEVLHRLSLLVWQCPGDRSASTFIQWLQEISPGEIYDCLVPWVEKFNEDMGIVRDRVTAVLSRWHEEYFFDIESTIYCHLRENAKYFQSLMATLSNENLIDRVTMGLEIIPEPETEQIILVPQYHSAPFSVIDYYKGIIVCQYPVNLPQMNPLEPPIQLTRTMKALADVNRLKILRFVEEGPQSLKSITDHLKLAKSNAHYHVLTLRLCGLLKARYGKNGTESYSKRSLVLEQMPAHLSAYISGGSNQDEGI